MCGVLAILFIVVPAVEIYALIAIGTKIGALATLAVIVATGILGATLARHQGLGAIRELQQALATGGAAGGIGQAMVEAALVLVAAVLLLTPGFLTDACGFSLLMPPFRRLVARILVKRYGARVTRQVVMNSFVPGPGMDMQDAPEHGDEHEPPPPGVIDV